MALERINMITVGSLFSGIGGLELGLERTGGFETIWFCENDEYASAVLRKHWPDVPNLGDITKVNWNETKQPDMLTGGFPCQDISLAGKRKGIKEGTRSGLWFEFHKAICILRPKLVLIENVSALSLSGLDIVLSKLAEARYDAQWFTLSASEVGAWHKRERLFIVSNSDNCGCVHGQAEKQPTEDRLKAFGKPFAGGEVVSDSDCSGFQEQLWRITERTKYKTTKRSGWWAVEPNVGRVAHGIPNRVDRIKCLGNAVVPQVAETIGQMILEVMK